MAKKILIAEDEKPLAKALQLKLNHEGFEAEIASDGEEALEHIKTGKYELVLLDLMMPKIDGFGVLESLQKAKSTVPVIVTTNLSQPEDLARVRSLGARGYLVKSNTPLSGIIQRIKELLDQT